MPGIAGLIAPGYSHHIIQRGNSRQQTFFSDADYAAYIDLMEEWCREGWRGHLWQGLFTSYVMDERYFIACVHYIETNPLRAGLAKKPEDRPWSSAAVHIKRESDQFLDVDPLLQMIIRRLGRLSLFCPGRERQRAIEKI